MLLALVFTPLNTYAAGKVGAVLTNDEKIGSRARKLRSHGIVRPFDEAHETPWFYHQEDLGWNYRLTDIQATLGRSQLAEARQAIRCKEHNCHSL